MKIRFTLTLIMAVALFSGCATKKGGLALNTVGPASDQTTMANSTNGTLIVYSAYEVNADFAGRDRRSPVYSDYKILTGDGRLLRKVHNNSGTILQDAVPAELAPGKYQVVAPANGYGHVTVPVMIETGRTTVLHLEGGGFWPDESVFNQTNAVRLPDGLIIGWRSTNVE